MEPVITVDQFENAREKSDDIWSDFDVFDEERDKAPLREIVLEVVESQYTHPAGPTTIYEMESSADELVWDKVFSSGLVPEELPANVREKFANKLAEAVRENATLLYKDVRKRVDPENEENSLSEVREVLEPRAEELVPETF
jgi:hypothetical protein